jgi:putative phosphoribosyl transferase
MFRDRVDAGRRLATVVEGAGFGGDGLVVLGLPRGGVPVAAEVAHRIDAPLDVIMVRKLGHPSQPELAMGAIGENGVRVANASHREWAAVDSAEIAEVEEHERAELTRRAQHYRKARAPIDLHGRLALIVDDGIATGSTAHAACRVARAHGASRIVLAVPVAPQSAVAALRDECDGFLCVAMPASFSAVGEWYGDFHPTSDQDVIDLLQGNL